MQNMQNKICIFWNTIMWKSAYVGLRGFFLFITIAKVIEYLNLLHEHGDVDVKHWRRKVAQEKSSEIVPSDLTLPVNYIFISSFLEESRVSYKLT